MTSTPTPTVTPTSPLRPVDLEADLSAAGAYPEPGAMFDYKLVIDNPDDMFGVTDIRIWDTLPEEVLFYITKRLPVAGTTVFVDGNFVIWTLPPSYVLPPGGQLMLEFTVQIDHIIEDGFITNQAAVDYTDPYNGGVPPGTGLLPDRHEPVFSNIKHYPDGEPVVYPNPFDSNIAVNGEMTFTNLIPRSQIHILTISGEVVNVLHTDTITRKWLCVNRFGYKVSPGIYYYVITSYDNPGVIYSGKLYIINP